tara:strand:+ start:2452 stop:4944 length:2493 start_codon:yes stop_codon:yes gene_type:complete
MAEQVYQDSNYRFSDPIRFFKANDPYYFEVDNIPLKQLQENCLWLKDQVRKDSSKLLGVKRGDIDELRPYATGGDRILRVNPGRYTARINDASTKTPLAYLNKVMGTAIGDVDAWSTALPNPGNFPNGKNAVLQAALDTFKQAVAQEAMGMTGLVERAFTWPVINSDTPIDHDGVNVVGLAYGDDDVNIPGGGAAYSPMLVTQALIWAKSQGSASDAYLLPSFETTNPNNGWAKFPRTESYFIKRWRGVSRLAIVDVDDEISIEVPQFDPDDFSYTDSGGGTTQVTGVESRIDLVFIYSKPVDSSGVNILKPSGKEGITKPTLGIVRGAGIKTNFQESSNITKDYLDNLNADHGILAHPGDQKNINMGFTSTSANDITQDVRGSFPAPDDILNIAPLISERLEDNAYELVGQSILPVAYVWVQSGSQVVLSTDVIDIRPLFRTAELAYNERAGIGAAFPQLSLANPAVGKGQLDYEIKRAYDNIQGQVDTLAGQSDTQTATNILATGYVFGGWNFGPEGALYDFYQGIFADDGNPDTNADAYIKQYIRSKYGIGGPAAQISVPSYPDWDLAQWCIEQDILDKGSYPNDYVNTFFSLQGDPDSAPDPSIVAGSISQVVYNDGTTTGGGVPTKLNSFSNMIVSHAESKVNFNYVAKKIKFDRPAWLADYRVDVDLVNCLAQNSRSINRNRDLPGGYFGHWVEKGFEEFTIYVAFYADPNTGIAGHTPGFPAPYTVVTTTGGGKKSGGSSNSVTLSQRDGGRFSGFVVPVGDILYSNTAPISSTAHLGYVGNPRIGKCTYPTVMWSISGIPNDDASHLYGNLNGTNPTITLKN